MQDSPQPDEALAQGLFSDGDAGDGLPLDELEATDVADAADVGLRDDVGINRVESACGPPSKCWRRLSFAPYLWRE